MRERLGSDLINHSRFSPGYAPPGWTQLTAHLRTLGADDAEILAAGLARVARSGRVIDTFRDRLVFPIHDHHGQICGFIGRRNPATPDAGPKYLNTAQTTVFAKGALLFGLHEGSDALAAGRGAGPGRGPARRPRRHPRHPRHPYRGRAAGHRVHHRSGRPT